MTTRLLLEILALMQGSLSDLLEALSVVFRVL
jgi:hypothetical protein